jgi:hypothetical protein
MGLEKYPGDIVTGKRFATGTFNPTKTSDKLTISDLTFSPSVIAYEHHYGGMDRRQVYLKGEAGNLNSTPYGMNTGTYSGQTFWSPEAWTVTPNGFSVVVLNSVVGYPVTWYAYE